MTLNISELSDLHPKQRIKVMVFGITVSVIYYNFLYDKNKAEENWFLKNEDVKKHNEKKINEMAKNGYENNKILDIIKNNKNEMKFDMTLEYTSTL